MLSNGLTTQEAVSLSVTADLSDAYATGIRVAQPLLRHFGGRRRFAGRIETVRVLEGSGLVGKALASAGEDRVLVVDAGGSVAALFGDRLAAIAIDNGWAGIVLNGYVRDSSDLAQMPLGVMAIGTYPQKSEKPGVGSQGEAVCFAGVVFGPGDWLYADEDGVIVSPTKL